MCEYICDECGKREKAIAVGHAWAKPGEWFERSDADGIQTACSRECIDAIAEKSGKTSVILPI